MQIKQLFGVAAIVPLAFAHSYHRRAAPVAPVGLCTTPDPNDRELEQIEVLAARDNEFARSNIGSGLSRRTEGSIVRVPVYMHAAVTANATADFLSADKLAQQLELMNQKYHQHDIQFELMGTTRTVNDKVARFTKSNSTESGYSVEAENYWKATRKGDYATLNMYFYTATAGQGNAGFATPPRADFPKARYWFDGAHIHADSMIGGAWINFNLGYTAVHETGHWLGLFHVFGNGQGCSADGDGVADTPIQSTPTQGCPVKPKNSCPNSPGVDSIHNYMDYSWDTCQWEFTEGQEARMHNAYTTIRVPKAEKDKQSA